MYSTPVSYTNLDVYKRQELAKDRLKLVLIHDRASLSPAMMDNLRRDLVEVISKYMDFEETSLDVQMAEQDNMTMLEVNIPVASVKRNGGN